MIQARREKRSGRARLLGMGLLALLGCGLPCLGAAEDEATDFADMSIEELMQIEITSVSKRAESLSGAPAAITVITAEDIRRSGHTSVPELLRMVPGIQVARIDSSRWAISARGFAGVLASKLLVLIDGRSVYSVTSSGVYWDMQDVRLEDIERIEVIRGPGGTLWGANAVNGVINIITKEAWETQGAELSAVYGSVGLDGDVDSRESVVGGRWGGKIGEDFAYRLHMLGTNRADYESPSGGDGQDGWGLYRGGFRADWDVADGHRLTFEGDGYGGDGAQTGGGFLEPPTFEIGGTHILGRWAGVWSERSSTHLQAYYDYTLRDSSAGTRETRQTVDIEFQHDLSLGLLALSSGVDYRVTWDDHEPSATIAFDPLNDAHHLASLFVQPQVNLLDDRLAIVPGIKLEYNDYSGFEYQPSLRIRGTLWEGHNLWIAASRAVRTPSRTDRDLRMNFLGFITIEGQRDFKSEKLIALEGGYRGAILPDLTLSASAFYFWYKDLQSSEGFPNIEMTNGMKAHTYGTEIEAAWDAKRLIELLPWSPVTRLRLIAGYSLIYVGTSFDVQNVAAENPEGTTPKHQFHFRAQLDLPYDLELDTMGYYVGSLSGEQTQWLPPLEVDDYFRLDLRLGWRPCDFVELSLIGQNLTEKRHREFNAFLDSYSVIPRSFFGKVTLNFF